MAFLNKREKEEKYQIQVFTRIRPFSKKEAHQKQHQRKCFEINSKHNLNVLLPHGSKSYNFDRIFNVDTSQDEIYKHTISPIVKDVLKGYNCTVMAYGQSGTGKTFTMFGRNGGVEAECDNGFLPRALTQIFDTVNVQCADFTMRVSFIEIYNEVLNDLLSDDDKKTLRVYEDRENKGSVYVHGIEEVQVLDKAKVYELLQIAAQKRKFAAAYLNQQSGRSHAIFTVNVHIRETSPIGEELYKIGKLTFVDLAASDMPPQTIENVQRSVPGENNNGLATLVRVTKALVERTSHIPHKESKLTRILQDSLGGKTKTTIIATVSPSVSNLDETINTLEFASKARHIVTYPEINQSLDKKTVAKRYQEEIERLRKDLYAARNKTGFYLALDNYNSIIKETEENREKALNAVAECSEFSNRIEELERKRSELLEVYAVTQNQLAGTKESLTRFRADLKLLRHDKRIRTELISRYEEAQTEHIEHSKKLSAELDNHIREHNILRSKVDNVYSTMEHNKNATNLLEKEYRKLASDLSESWTKLKQDTVRHFDIERDARCDQIAGTINVTNALCNSAENIYLFETESIDAIHKHLQKADESIMSRHLCSLKLSDDDAIELKNIFEEERQALAHAFEPMFVDKSQAYKKLLSKQMGLFKEYEDEFEKKTDLWLQTNDTMIKNSQAQAVKVDEFIDKSKITMQKFREQRNNLKKLVDATVANTQLICDRQESVMDTFTEDNKLAVALINEQKTTCTHTLNEDLKDLRQRKDAMDQIVQTRTEQRSADIDNLISHLHDIQKQFASGLHKVKQVIERNQMQMEDACSNEQLEQDAFLQAGLQITQDKLKTNDELHEDFNEQIKQAESTLNTYNTIISNNDSHITKTIEQRVADCYKMCSEMSGVVNTFIGQYEILKPNGDTPGRKTCVTYPVPRKVSSKIIQKFNTDDLAPLDESTEEDGNAFLELCDSSDTEGEYRGQYVTTQFKSTQ